MPSEDLTAQNSGSIDWKIVVPLESHREANSYSQDGFDQSLAQESINDRIDDELESNPDDDLGISGPDQADLFAQEFMDLIIAEYLEDNTYTVSRDTKNIDEELFKHKFPYTLDTVVPELVIRPPQPMVI